MLGSFQNFIATPLHAVAESNVSLAHLNFDFSLVKVEAPPELVPLGKKLSKARRESAEEGSFHILAQRLGVLFDNVLPEVPELLEAYGTRASEIVLHTTQNTEKPRDIVNGFFGSHLGIDSTTIWASATSGRSVLRIHLLACILARIWSPEEATAIWAELVAQRQSTIKQQAQSSEVTDNYLAQLAAAHDIHRSSLGSWDASARAWLQVADQARKKEQIQAQLIVNNLSVGVKSDGASDQSFTAKINTYDSVLPNVTRALTTLNKLIRGEPQWITDGGILLGLVSWHIYPDIVVLGSKTTEIQQSDSLVKRGGLVTISISSQAGHGDGVHWSLPLSSLRYYGTVQRERSTMRDSRLSVPQFQALILGASLNTGESIKVAAEILCCLWDTYNSIYYAKLRQLVNKPPLEREEKRDKESNLVIESEDILKDSPYLLKHVMEVLHLIFPLRGGIDQLLSAEESERQTAGQLIRYGKNNGRAWLGNTSNSQAPAGLFGLESISSLLYTITTPQARVQLLRDLCTHYQLSPADHVIRFKTSKNKWSCLSIIPEMIGTTHGGTKRKRDHDDMQDRAAGRFQTLDAPAGENWVFMPPMGQTREHVPETLGESESESDEDVVSEFLKDDPSADQYVIFDFAFGNRHLAAVHVRRSSSALSRERVFPSVAPLPMIRTLLSNGQLKFDIMLEFILRYFKVTQPAHGRSLLCLGRVIDYYNSHLSQATVSMGVIKNPLSTWKWASTVFKDLELLSPIAEQLAHEDKIPRTIYPSPLHRTHAFAAILQFESGSVNVDISDLMAVLAISSGNSLFIAEDILRDPIYPREISPCAVSHIMGNIGKPGVTLLIPTPEPNIREHDIEKWHFVNHHPFDGRLFGGRFEGTSLHLSFTGWEGPISLGASSYRGMEAYYVETAVSVNDGGEWVGDLDILQGLRDMRLGTSELVADKACSHDPSFAAAGAEITSIDCWEEILDPPDGFLVLRSTPDSHDERTSWNWMVRLAAVGLASSRKYECICLPVGKEFCWTCVIQKLRSDHEDTGNGPKVLLVC